MEDPKLAQNMPQRSDDPPLRTGIPYRPHQVSVGKVDEFEPVRSDRELCNTASVYVSATNLFESVNQESLQETQRAEYGEYIDCMTPKHLYLKEKR